MLHKIDPTSTECIPPGFGFFQTPPTTIAVLKSQYKEILQLNPVSDPPFHFKVAAGTSFLDWKDSFVYISLKVFKKNADGNFVNLEDADNVGVVQLMGTSFIRNVKVNVGGQQIYNANNLYAYKAYFDNELSCNRLAKESYLRSAGYFICEKDDQNSATSKDFLQRKSMILDGKPVEYISKLHVDIFDQELYFLNNTEVEIEIHPNNVDFMILAPGTSIDEFKIEYLSCKLYVKSIDAQPKVNLDVETNLEKFPARYGIRRTELKTLYFEQGRSEVNYTLFSDLVPRRIICAMTAKDAYNGHKQKSPFQFDHFNLRDIRASWNGQQIPAVPYELDYKTDRYVRAYFDLYQALGYAYSNDSCGITYDMYKKGWAIYVFNLTSTGDNDECFDLLKEGSTSLYLKFAEDVPKGGITMIVYAEFDSLMMIDKNRNIKTDLSV